MSKGACSQDQDFLMLHGSVPGPLSSQRAREPPQGQGCSLRNCPRSGWSPAALCLTSSPISSAELLPHLGGLQLQGHEAAFPAEVRLLGAPQLGGDRRKGAHLTTDHPTVHLPRTTVLAAVAFLDAFQKVADMATNTRGGEGAWLEVGAAPGQAWRLERLSAV